MSDTEGAPDKLNEALKQAAVGLGMLKKLQEREQAQRESCTAAENLLAAVVDRDRTRAELLEAYRVLNDAHQRAELTIDADLAEQYQERLEQFDAIALRQSRRRRKLVSIVVLLGAMAAAGGLYAWYRYRVSHVVVELEGLIAADKLADAQDSLKRLRDQSRWDSRWVGGHPRVQELDKTVEEGIANERSRAAKFSNALQAAQAGGTEQPDATVLDKAIVLAKTQAEKDAVQNLKQMRQDSLARTLKAKLDRISAELDRVKQHGLQDAKDETFQDLGQRLSDLKTEAAESGVSIDVAAETEFLRTARSGRAQARLASIEASLTEPIANRKSYEAALEAYVSELPQGRWSADFNKALKEKTLWEGVEEWSKIAEAWESFSKNLKLATPHAAAKLLEQFDQLAQIDRKRNDGPAFETKMNFKEQRELLEAIRARLPDGKPPPRKRLEDRFELMRNLWMAETTEEKRCYSKTQLLAVGQSPPTKLPIHYLLDLAGNVRYIELPNVKRTARAPQSILADTVLQELKGLETLSAWEYVFFKIILCIKSQNDLDPLSQVVLLRFTLEVAGEGSYPLRRCFAQDLKLLKDPQVPPEVNWLDPNQAVKHKDSARLLLNSLRLSKEDELVKIRKEAGNLQVQLSKTRIPHYRWLGHLLRENEKPWKCVHNPLPGVQGGLCVVRQVGKETQFAPVGKVENSQLKLSEPTEAFRTGRPVFLQVPPKP